MDIREEDDYEESDQKKIQTATGPIDHISEHSNTFTDYSSKQTLIGEGDKNSMHTLQQDAESFARFRSMSRDYDKNKGAAVKKVLIDG